MTRAVQICLDTAVHVNRELAEAIAIADDMLSEAQSLGVAAAIEDIASVVEQLEAIGERTGTVPLRLGELLARIAEDSTTSSPARTKRSTSRVRKPAIVDGLTLPTRAPDPEAVAPGVADVAPRSRAEFQEDLEFQRRTADQLAQAGFEIMQLERDPHQVSPDFTLEGHRFDCFTPRSGTTPDSIRSTLRGKMKKGQAVRFVINMDRSEYGANDLRRRLARSSSSRLVEVIVIKNRTIEWDLAPELEVGIVSIEISLIGVFPESLSEQAAIRKAAVAVGKDPAVVAQTDPRFDSDGLLVFSLEPDEEDQELTKQHFGFKSNLHILFAEHSGSDDNLMIRAWHNMLRVVLAFARDESFRGELIEDYTDSGYLAHVADGVLTLNENYWQSWEATSDLLSVVPQPHHFAYLYPMK